MPRTDGPTGGRHLTRQLARWLPVALVAGLAVGIPLAIVAGEWRLAPMVGLGAPAIVGVVLAAIEDGRVNRRVNESRADDGPPEAP